jgi:hypothetical protein
MKIVFLDLLHCSCDRVLREKSSIQSLMGDDFPLYDSEIDANDSLIDSDEDQIEQYTQAAVLPLKYQEMPKPVIDSKRRKFNIFISTIKFGSTA